MNVGKLLLEFIFNQLKKDKIMFKYYGFCNERTELLKTRKHKQRNDKNIMLSFECFLN